MGTRMYSSCEYRKPTLFGPAFSSFFFGALFSGFINNQLIIIYQKQNETHNELKQMRKELEQLQKSK
jgi:hypothetical protein